MTLMIGLSPVRFAPLSGSSTPVPPPPPTVTFATLPVAPAARWHAGQNGATVSGGRVQSAPGLVGPAVSAGAAGIGPQALEDLLGRKFWRFQGTEYLDVGAGLTFSNRAMAVFAVGRILAGNTPVFGIGNRTGYGAGPTWVNTGGAALDSSTSGLTAPFLRSFSRTASGDSANGANVVAGQQMQVMGALARTTANGGTRLYINDRMANVSQSSIGANNVAGAEIGRRVDAPGSSGSWAQMDIYEIVVYDLTLSNAEGDSVAAALVAHWGIPAITSQVVLEGDSIMAGVGIASGNNTAQTLSRPGAGFVPASARVVSTAISGSQVPDLVARRQSSNGWATAMVGGTNTVVFEIGRNDLSGVTAAQHYANVVAYLNTPGTGVLQRGWHVRVMANIASSSSLQSRIEDFRALLIAPQFLNDVQAAPGQAFAGRVAVIRADLITKAPDGTVFATTADAVDGIYYQGDATHPTEAGMIARATGADTLEYGIAAGLA